MITYRSVTNLNNAGTAVNAFAVRTLHLLLIASALFLAGCAGSSGPVAEVDAKTPITPSTTTPPVAAVAPVVVAPQESPLHTKVRGQLADKVFYLGRVTSRNVFTEKRPGFCDQFLIDWQAQRNITYLAPVVKTDDYHDPALLTYTSRYDGILRQTIARYYGIEDGRRKSFYGQSDFRIYEADFDNLPENGNEIVFSADQWSGSTGYKLLHQTIDLKLVVTQLVWNPARVIDGVPSLNNLAEVIQYDGYTLMVGMTDFGHPDEGVYSIQLHMFGPLQGGKDTLVCSFSQLKSPLDELFLKQ